MNPPGVKIWKLGDKIRTPTITHDEFIEAVMSCIGTPVVHMGRTPGVGLDCVGLPWAACAWKGLAMQETRQYFGLPSAEELSDGLADFCTLTYMPTSLDAHVLQVYAGRVARHVVVPVSQDMVVHAWGKSRLVQLAPLRSFRVHSTWMVKGVV